MADWQPIETAPKDQRILAVTVGGEMHVVWWANTNLPDAPRGWTTGYFNQFDDQIFLSDLTHWMPLPEPPKNET